MSYMTAAAWIGAALVAAGTAANAYGTSKANRQANSVLLDALKQSKENGDDVTKKIMEALPEYETDNRLKQQEALSDQTKQAISQPVENVQLNTATKGGTQGDVSSDYTTARARANAQTLEDVRNLAQMMGAVTSAQRLRQNEGFRLADLQNEINLMNSFNNGNQRVAQLRAQAKAEGQQGWKLGGQIASALGSAISMGAGLAASAPSAAAAATETGLGATSAASGITPAMSEAIDGAQLTPAMTEAYAAGLVGPSTALTGAVPRVAKTTGGIGSFFTGIPKKLGF